jgi:DNA-binding NarL/FixJ family response regulator
LVVDSQPLVRLGVREALKERFEIHESETREEALELVRDIGSIDVAIVDLRHRASDGSSEVNRALSGHDAIRALRKAEPSLGIVAHGERAERHLATAALQAGATAYVSRTAGTDALHKAVYAALAQERFVDPAVPGKGSRGTLTHRQREILQMLANGGTPTAAARQLGLSEETIKTHMKNALARLGARNRTHAVAIALRESIIE